MRIITFVNPKGGVGKSTSVANISMALAQSGRKVLLVELDVQQSLSDYFVIEGISEETLTLDEMLLSPHRLDPNEGLVDISGNLALLPSYGIGLRKNSLHFSNTKDFSCLSTVLEKLTCEFDYILIDTPGSLESPYVSMAISAANEIIVPIQPTDMDADATARFFDQFEEIKQEYNPNIKLSGIFFMRYQKALDDHKTTVDGLFSGSEYEDVVFKTAIRNSGDLQRKAPPGGSVFEVAPRSIGSIDCKNLAKEIDNA